MVGLRLEDRRGRCLGCAPRGMKISFCRNSLVWFWRREGESEGGREEGRRRKGRKREKGKERRREERRGGEGRGRGG